ncbi:hypothetical protein LINPERHAP1_LOCUS6794 [Linum perenne]
MKLASDVASRVNGVNVSQSPLGVNSVNQT